MMKKIKNITKKEKNTFIIICILDAKFPRIKAWEAQKQSHTRAMISAWAYVLPTWLIFTLYVFPTSPPRT